VVDKEPIGKPPEAEKGPKVRSSKVLAEALGFSRTEGEKPGSWYRSYEKPVSVPGGEGTAWLAFIDDGPDRWGPKDELIEVGLNEVRTSGAVLSHLDPDIFEKLDLERGLYREPPRDTGAFSKRSLKQGGFQRLYGYLKELEEFGYFKVILADKLQQEEAERAHTAEICPRLLGIAQPKVFEHFPEYAHVDAENVEEGSILFYKPGRARTARASVLILSTKTEVVRAAIGTARLKENGTGIDRTTWKGIKEVFYPNQMMRSEAEKKHGWDRITETLDKALDAFEHYLATGNPTTEQADEAS
jgi:hypothetical protein